LYIDELKENPLHNTILAVKASIWKALQLLEVFVNDQLKGQITKKTLSFGMHSQVTTMDCK
jgi:hypothetical protein